MKACADQQLQNVTLRNLSRAVTVNEFCKAALLA